MNTKRRKPTIYEIKAANESPDFHYFDRDTLRYFGQTMRSFSVSWNDDAKCWETSAPAGPRGVFFGKQTSVAHWDADSLKFLRSVGGQR